MRRALGLSDAPVQRNEPQERPSSGGRPADRHTADRHKRRFVRDGEVPVVVIQGRRDHAADNNPSRLTPAASPTNRVDVAETAFKTERDARERTERCLADAQATIRDLQTKLGHAMLARDEALAGARRAEADRLAAEQALRTAEAALLAEQTARDRAELTLQDLLAEQVAPKPARQASLALPVPAPAAKAPQRKAVARAKPRADSGETGKPAREPQPVKWWIKRTPASKRR